MTIMTHLSRQRRRRESCSNPGPNIPQRRGDAEFQTSPPSRLGASAGEFAVSDLNTARAASDAPLRHHLSIMTDFMVVLYLRSAARGGAKSPALHIARTTPDHGERRRADSLGGLVEHPAHRPRRSRPRPVHHPELTYATLRNDPQGLPAHQPNLFH